MTWYYAEAGKQMGPVDDSALDDLVRQGLVRDDTLVWREGMATWQPHGVVRPRPSGSVATAAMPPSGGAAAAAFPAAAPPPGAQPGETRYCAECGRPFPAQELSMVGASAVCATCRPAVVGRMGSIPAAMQPMGQPVMAGARHYGGFWIRFVAVIIDAIILACANFILTFPLRMLGLSSGLAISRDPTNAIAALPMIMLLSSISFLISIGLSLFYEVYFLTSRGATPGKIALGLKVIRADGGPITAGLAVGRYFSRWLSWLTLLIGFIIAGFDIEKRALHDRIVDTRVIYAK